MTETTKRKGGLKGLVQLSIGALCIWAFLFVVGPAMRVIPEVDAVCTYVLDTGMNASALYWTDVEETADAEINSIHTIYYAPTGPAKKL